MEHEVRSIRILGAGTQVEFFQDGEKLVLSGVSALPKDETGCGLVFAIECDRPPSMYIRAGMRTPSVRHPHYDPLPPDIAY